MGSRQVRRVRFEGELDLTPHIRRAFKAPAKGLHVFRSDADILKEREAARMEHGA